MSLNSSDPNSKESLLQSTKTLLKFNIDLILPIKQVASLFSIHMLLKPLIDFVIVRFHEPPAMAYGLHPTRP